MIIAFGRYQVTKRGEVTILQKKKQDTAQVALKYINSNLTLHTRLETEVQKEVASKQYYKKAKP